MKEIELTQCEVALVDDADHEWLSQHKWYVNNTGTYLYAARTIWDPATKKKRRLYMHRAILDAPAHLQADHINHNGLDNRRANLRLCTMAQNQANSRKRRRHTSSRFKGVSWHKATRNWRAAIKIGQHHKTLGYFEDEVEAARAYDVRAQEAFGEFAKLNFALEGE